MDAASPGRLEMVESTRWLFAGLAVVKMAAQMGMRTIAEGVDSREQQRYLETIGADAVQGFFYLRPTTPEGFVAWFDMHLNSLPATRPTSDVVIQFAPRHTA